MPTKEPSSEIRKKLLALQKGEITEYHIYSRLADVTQDPHNRGIIQQIAEDEREHYRRLKKYTGKEVKPHRMRIHFYYWIGRLLGLTFGMQLLEQGEEDAQEAYAPIVEEFPQLHDIICDEDRHEQEILEMLDEETLQYAGSVVLGLNDALVELTGTLAGLTFAFQNTELIALSGLITGIAASFSMAASQYLSTRADGEKETAAKSALYTGGAYILTVFLLILPYLLLDNYLLCLVLTLIIAVTIIAVFNYYLAIAKRFSFRKRFFEMAGISLGVALFSFGVGYVVRAVFGVEV
ncbi:MAG: VIT1/CCC1 transporter family protein [Anaerolineales bacterium]